MSQAELRIKKLPGIDYLVIEKMKGSNFFWSNDASFVISVDSLSHLLLVLLRSGYIDKSVLENILKEISVD